MQKPSWILWNLSLAFYPVLLAYALAWVVTRFPRFAWLAWLTLGVTWLAFLPNTCYLLTEWRHFFFDAPFERLRADADTNRERLKVAQYGLFFLGYSGFGVLCFGLSIRPIAQVVQRGRLHPFILAVPFFFLLSLGVYLGLIVRLNSWDIIQRPGKVWDSIVIALQNQTLLQVLVIFAALLWLLYGTVNIWLDGMSHRMQEWGVLPKTGKREVVGGKRKEIPV